MAVAWLTSEDYLTAVDSVVAAIVEAVEVVGDPRINEVPDVDGANSPFAIATHCAGVIEFWGLQVLDGAPGERDREGELSASGSVAQAVDRLRDAHSRFTEVLRSTGGAAVAAPERARDGGAPPDEVTVDGLLLHVFRKLAQHCGHLELTRDLLLAG